MTATTTTPPTVIQRFLDSVDAYPDRPAIWARGETRTYAELSRDAAGILMSIRSQGLEGAERIGIVTGDDWQTYAAILAILANGSAYVPLNRKSPVARNLAVLDEACPDAVLYSEPDETVKALESVGDGSVVTLGIGAAACEAEESLSAGSVPEAGLAYVFFTSGSTGTPKGVPISHANLNRFMSVVLDSGIYRFGPEDRFLQMFELTFDLSVMSFFAPLGVGACCYVVPESRVGYVTTLKVLRDERITVALMVPSLLVYLEQFLTGLTLPALRISLFCGEALPESVTEKWQAVAPDCLIENVYGPTEATIFCLRYPWSRAHSPDAAVNGLVPIGIPFPGMTVALLGPDGNVATASGKKGELLLMGEQVTTGYWRNPTKTDQAFVGIDHSGHTRRAYRTGDLCFVDERGDYVYCSRLDGQVKIDGHRVELGEIEHHLRELLGRSGLAVVDVADGLRRQLVVFVEKPQPDWPDLVERLEDYVPAYMVPKHCRCLERLPLNLNGKVDRPLLRTMFSGGDS